MEQPNTSPSARRIAKTILNGFDAHFADFQNITLGAKARFEKADWIGNLQAHAKRLDIYKAKILEVVELIQEVTNKDIHDIELWKQARIAYAQLVAHHSNYEIAETFFNSIFNKCFQHQHIHDRNIFVRPSRPMEEKPVPEYSITIPYSTDIGLEDFFRKVMDDFSFSAPWDNLQRDIKQMCSAFQADIAPRLKGPRKALQIDMLESVFYRYKAAYIVGRIRDGDTTIPLLIACRNNKDSGVFVDALISQPDDVSIIFSFTRSYFMVDAPMPSRFVRFLKTLMPRKTLAELYNSLGLNKHGKTEFYRHIIQHMKDSDDQYVTAAGIKGMVMTVFTLPSYNQVFKVIKDKFDYPKTVTEKIVKEKYQLVARSDKAGRMADTQEYSNFIFYRNRFSDALIEELQRTAPSKLILTDSRVIIKHLYTERRMTPLNIYLTSASEEQIYDVMDEYGNAIKQLATANIFPGDMLLKNFGVTRHNRVVFYDYDEICQLTDCNFRKIPEPQNEQQEMADRPWYPIAENDVFPEEFRLFFSGNHQARKAFESLHGELYDYQYWQDIQSALKKGRVIDALPYRRVQRFDRQESANNL